MDKIISYKFNIDTVCVEVKYADVSMIFIDSTAVENEVADNMYECLFFLVFRYLYSINIKHKRHQHSVLSH